MAAEFNLAVRGGGRKEANRHWSSFGAAEHRYSTSLGFMRSLTDISAEETGESLSLTRLDTNNTTGEGFPVMVRVTAIFETRKIASPIKPYDWDYFRFLALCLAIVNLR
ncbi:hypothetical protein KM043_012837 [Ampulex compressa]|nr:hypothetical protein KM043_012837 [Ampulex compressa]